MSGEAGQHAADVGIDKDQAQELMQQFAALGYIEDPKANKEKQAESAEIEARYNVARTMMWREQPDKALPLLEDIVRRRPWEERFLIQLADAYFRAGYLRQAERLLSAAYPKNKAANPNLLLQWSRLKLALGELAEGLEGLQTASQLNPHSSQIHMHLGNTYLKLGHWDKAEAAFEKAVSLEEDNAFAHQGLSTVYRRRGDMDKTASAALRAVGLLHRLPRAHFNLGVALARTGEWDRARLALETALRFDPKMINAHRYLTAIHKVATGEAEKARFHREEARRLLPPRDRRESKVDARHDTLFDLPAIPSHEERHAMLLRERPDPKSKQEDSGKTFVLVSGLPRSGTSLMMQLLAAGGMEVMTDSERAADVDNPRGYYEWEAIKQVGQRPEILDDKAVNGKAIKCVSMLLPKMPAQHRYKVIFMVRPIGQVVASQHDMTKRLGTKGAELDPEQLARGLRIHRDETIAWFAQAPYMEHIEVSYPALVRDPVPVIAQLTEFLGANHLPHADKMREAVDPTLHHKKGKLD